MPLRTEAIKAFLDYSTLSDLAGLYTPSMECQVLVAQDNGERIEGEFKGVKWSGYTDDSGQVWKPFRIPRNASTNPEYVDTEMSFDLGLHAEGIGMTGWDWANKVSKWVAFDFDAMVGHSANHTSKLTIEQLDKVRTAASEIPWVTVRYSTSGKGLHLYVFLDDVPTINHTEHAALARSILAKMTSLTGHNFQAEVDIAGSNMWVWHRKMKGTNGLSLIKRGSVLTDIPPNWRDHVPIATGKQKKINAGTDVEGLAAQSQVSNLTDEHLVLIKFLNDNNLYHWYDADHQMLVTHTLHLKKAHEALKLRGFFETTSTGSTTHNCFLFPIKGGGWSVRRYSRGCQEHASWETDAKGWTRCFINQEPTVKSAATANGGIEDPAGGYVFNYSKDAATTARQLGADLVLPDAYTARTSKIKLAKDGRLVIEFEAEDSDKQDLLVGWLRKGSKWTKLFHINRQRTTTIDIEKYDDTVRHIVTEDSEDGGWALSNQDGTWINEPLGHIQYALSTLGLLPKEIKPIIGSSVMKPWTLTIQPFKPEYPGNRVWNRKAPQFNFVPSISDILSYPTWLAVLNHLGQGLDEALKENAWAMENGIKTGRDYLKTWVASLFQHPFEPLPYLFIYGEKQNTGKSTFHEALSLLFNPGYSRIDHALQNTSFNGELEGAILCVIEETDFSDRSRSAYNKIKDWVTSPRLSIHRKGQTPYMVPNTGHFVQTSNDRPALPVFPGDTRITMIHVEEAPKVEIPKRLLMESLEREAADFLAACLNLDIPESGSRLRIPVIETVDKINAAQLQKNSLTIFLEECCYYAPGHAVKISDFYDRFVAWLEPLERLQWSTKNKVSAGMPDKYPKGRLSSNPSWHYGNISFDLPTNLSEKPFILVGEFLRAKKD